MIAWRMKQDIDMILGQDPAARSAFEVIFCYPGFHAVTLHRLSHSLYRAKLYFLARFISQLGRIFTGIEINPGATLGHRVFIDHGMGVVIGETAVVGDDVVIYQGVTLGAGSEARMGAITRGKKRHPTLGNGVIVGSGAEIQGDITVGNNVRIASGSILLKDVPDNCVVVGAPGRIIYRDGQKITGEMPDLVADAIKSLKDHINRLEAKVDGIYNSESSQGGDNGEPDPLDIFLHGAGI
jgi:serine O-acetyltransferase